MTNEEAIEYLEDAKIKFKIPKAAVTARKTNEALDMAIKALEPQAGQREYLLNKVKAEIEKLQTYKMFVGEKTVYVELSDVLAIIDKHKGESDGTDAGSN